MDGVVGLREVLLKVFLAEDSGLEIGKDCVHLGLELYVLALEPVDNNSVFLDSFIFILDSDLKVLDSLQLERSLLVQMIELINLDVFLLN